MTRFWLSISLIGSLWCGSVPTAQARDVDGRWAQSDPQIRDWIRDLKNQRGAACCDTADGHEVEGWTMAGDRYRIKIEGGWIDVPPHAVIDGQNRLGYARAWLRYENGLPVVVCFLPGAGG